MGSSLFGNEFTRYQPAYYCRSDGKSEFWIRPYGCNDGS